MLRAGREAVGAAGAAPRVRHRCLAPPLPRALRAAPALQATIKRRIVLDRFVVDWEHVNGVPEGAFDAIATYEVVNGRIVKVWFLRP